MPGEELITLLQRRGRQSLIPFPVEKVREQGQIATIAIDRKD
jgi:hypothetical protein